MQLEGGGTNPLSVASLRCATLALDTDSLVRREALKDFFVFACMPKTNEPSCTATISLYH
eukprot:scaffold7340_cov266-Pinguiococcus_pyrenoidosus.AAC.63